MKHKRREEVGKEREKWGKRESDLRAHSWCVSTFVPKTVGSWPQIVIVIISLTRNRKQNYFGGE